MKKRQKTKANELNDKTYLFYYNRLMELAISMFEWKNLPDSIDPRFLELSLYNDGMAIFFKDDVLGLLALQTMIGGNLSVYRIPKIRRAYATNGYNKPLNDEDSVIIYNNYSHTNTILGVEMYARRIANLERTIDVNVYQQKTPRIIQCTENQRQVMQVLLQQYEGNEVFIYGDKNLDLNLIKIHDITAPYVADKLNDLKREIFNEALTYLGISNVNIQKKERLITDEVTRNMGSTEAQKYTRLNSRKEACKQVNKMFGLNIDVEYREDIKMLEQLELGTGDEKEGEDDE